MPCPFPGMDPYIERPALFPDFHDRLITYSCEALAALLPPKYAALTANRLYVVESERPVKPDVSVVRLPGPKDSMGGVAVLEADAPAVFELWREEMREPLIHIIEPAAEDRIVTAIEILSPDNKRPGAGRTAYLQKREEFWASGTNLVEVDLLRDGDATVRIAASKLAALQPWHYLVAVTRRWPSRQEVYPIPLQQRLPRVSIPLADNDADVVLDVQTVFSRCWAGGSYPALLRYDGPPPGTLTPEDVRWCEERLRESGMRPSK